MFILPEAAGKLVNTLILLPTHSSAKDFDKSDNTCSSKSTEMFLKIRKILSPLFILLSIYSSSSMRGGLRGVLRVPVGFGCMSGEDFPMSHLWLRGAVLKEMDSKLSHEGLTSASLRLCSGVSGQEAVTRLRSPACADTSTARWAAETRGAARVSGPRTPRPRCADWHSARLAQTVVGHEGLGYVFNPLPVSQPTQVRASVPF